MLMITTTMGMFNRVHADTTNLWPAVAFDLVLVISTSCFQQGFVDTSTSCNDTNTCTIEGGNNLLDT